MAHGWTRRNFLRLTGSAATLALANLSVVGGTPERAAGANALPEVPAYRGWEDLYRTQWTWDSVARGTHTMTNCVSGCAWNLFVKDGMVWREQIAVRGVVAQVADLSARLPEGRVRVVRDVLAVAPAPAQTRQGARQCRGGMSWDRR
jgi:hypothetical protein